MGPTKITSIREEKRLGGKCLCKFISNSTGALLSLWNAWPNSIMELNESKQLAKILLALDLLMYL